MQSFIRLGAAAGALILLPLLSATPVRAQEWCGFRTNTKSALKCGYSSEAKCREAMGKDAVCILDPFYADVRRRWRRG